MEDIGHAIRPNYEPGTPDRCCAVCYFAMENEREDGTVDCTKIHGVAVLGDHPLATKVCGWFGA